VGVGIFFTPIYTYQKMLKSLFREFLPGSTSDNRTISQHDDEKKYKASNGSTTLKQYVQKTFI